MFGGFSPKLFLRPSLLVLLCAVIAVPAMVKPKDREAKKSGAKSAVISAEPFLIEPHLGHARVHFRRHEYRDALLFLGDKIDDREALFIAAESNYRLGKYSEATRFFERIVDVTTDPIERRKALIRLFDIDIKTKDTQSAISRYVAFGKEYKKPTVHMHYSLGKALFDMGYFERSESILRRVPKGNEFSMRARYLVATMSLDKNKSSDVVKLFNQIEMLKPVSVEDYSVRELAILAQGRIYAEAKKEDLASSAYARVGMAGEFGETATIETIRTMLVRAEEARLQQGRFKKSSAFRRRLIESAAIAKALESITRYRKVHEIDWRSPELLTLMARLLVEAKRYSDARIAYQELIDHYRAIYTSLAAKNAEREVWPFFALDFERDLGKSRTVAMIPGVAAHLVKDVPDVKDILLLRDNVEADELKLRKLEERATNFAVRDDAILAARAKQTAIINSYNAMVVKKQNRFKEVIADQINRSLAEAEFRRAELVVIEMGDLKKQQGAVHDFQGQKIDEIESSLKKLDEGDAL